jgi:hypothetical protein
MGAVNDGCSDQEGRDRQRTRGTGSRLSTCARPGAASNPSSGTNQSRRLTTRARPAHHATASLARSRRRTGAWSESDGRADRIIMCADIDGSPALSKLQPDPGGSPPWVRPAHLRHARLHLRLNLLRARPGPVRATPAAKPRVGVRGSPAPRPSPPRVCSGPQEVRRRARRHGCGQERTRMNAAGGARYGGLGLRFRSFS